MAAAKKLAAVPDEIDLADAFEEIDVSPKPVKLGGRTYLVRRDLTSAEVEKFWKLAGQKDDAAALEVLVVEGGRELSAAIAALPARHSQPALDRVLDIGQVPGRKGDTGEYVAS